RYIELVLLWEGQLTTKQLCDTFSIGRQQANKDLSNYRRAQEKNALRYDPVEKYYVPSPDFSPRLTRGLASEYLQLIAQDSDIQKMLGQLPLSDTRVELVAAPNREVPPQLLRPIIQAMRNQERVEVDYVSLNNPDREGRIIAPHTLVWTGYRWHVRAWCEKNRDFRDFVLSRFRGDAELLGSSEQNATTDLNWQQIVTLKIVPDPRLSSAQQEVISHDYSMQNNALCLTVRAKLARYLLQLLNIKIVEIDEDPRAQQLILSNASELERWLR
ncbi:MAG: WYL domain-containing protein, partial [Luminiphilus sp.]|nr:WYL domain-containing protein [Luminiphilus sp.]